MLASMTGRAALRCLPKHFMAKSFSPSLSGVKCEGAFTCSVQKHTAVGVMLCYTREGGSTLMYGLTLRFMDVTTLYFIRQMIFTGFFYS